MSSSICVTPDLLAGFLDEAVEYLGMLDDGLLAFEAKAGTETLMIEEPEDHERMNEMFRAAHSFKGLGAAMGFEKIRDLTHVMETLFDRIRMGKQGLDPASIETLFGVFDNLRALVGELTEEPPEPITIEESLQSLRLILDAPSDKPNAGPSDEAGHQTAAPAPGGGPVEEQSTDEHQVPNAPAPPSTSSTAIASDGLFADPAMTQLFLETTAETIEDLNQKLLLLEKTPADLELLNEIFRCAHNIKGATGAAGCSDLYQMTHDMESALDQLRSHEIQLEEELINALFSAVDRLRGDIELIKQGRTSELEGRGPGSLFGRWVSSEKSSDGSSAGGGGDSSEVTDGGSGAEPGPEEGDSGVLVITVTFPPDFAESEIQSYLIHNKLTEFGDVLSTDPDIDSLDGSSVLEVVRFVVNTSMSPAEIEPIVASYSAKHVKVERQGAQAPSSADSNVTAPKPCTATSASTGTVSLDPPKTSAVAATSQHSPASSADTASATGATTAAATPAAEPAATHPSPKPSASSSAAKKPVAAKANETLRVDLERLDQLMNLGGELVINKARLVQIRSLLEPLFSGQNVGSMVDDMSERIGRLNDKVGELTSAADPRLISELADASTHLVHDFDVVKNVVRRVHEARPFMNDFSEALHGLNRISEGIQKSIMATRMVPIGPLFQRFRRVVRDMAKSTNKKVDLVLKGEGTELDKRMIDELGDPLTHMIRNSVDHGLETPDERIAAGKDPTGRVTLDAFHRGRHICIEVRDDGKGINIEAVKRKIVEQDLLPAAQVEQMSDKAAIQYVFRPGFSTAEKVTDLSGRGMGMDIVMNKLDAINGTVEIESVTGKGACVTIKLPLTLAIITAIVARIGKGVYAIPLETVAEIITIPRSSLQSVHKQQMVRVRDQVIPVAFFEDIFDTTLADLQTAGRDSDELTLVILSLQKDRIGLVVDELIGQEDVVIKSLSANFQNVQGVAGASIMGDGSVSLILDVAALMSMFADHCLSRANDESTMGTGVAAGV